MNHFWDMSPKSSAFRQIFICSVVKNCFLGVLKIILKNCSKWNFVLLFRSKNEKSVAFCVKNWATSSILRFGVQKYLLWEKMIFQRKNFFLNVFWHSATEVWLHDINFSFFWLLCCQNCNLSVYRNILRTTFCE